MSVQAISWVLDHSPATGTDRLVLISLANHADQRGESSWPSVHTIMREAGASERAVQQSLRNLETEGRIVVVVNGAPDERIPQHRRPNLYRVLMTHIAARRPSDPLAQHACDVDDCGRSYTSQRGLDLHRRSHESRQCACGKTIRLPGWAAHQQQCGRGVMEHAPAGVTEHTPMGREATRQTGVTEHARRGVMDHTQTIQSNRPSTVPRVEPPGALPLRDGEHEAQEHRPARTTYDHIDERGRHLVSLIALRLADQHPDAVVARLYAPWDAGCRVTLGRRLAALEDGGWPADTLAVELAGIVHEPERLTSIAGLIKHRADELEDRPVVLAAAEHAAPARAQADVDDQHRAETHGRNLAAAGIPLDEIAYLLVETYRGQRAALDAALTAAGIDPANVDAAPPRFDAELEVWG